MIPLYLSMYNHACKRNVTLHMVFLEHIYNHEYILEMHTQLQIMLNKYIGEPEEDEKKALFLLTSLMSKRDNLAHASIYEEFQVSF